ncbi:MAG: lysophospholipase [Myxococcota bacterium]
MAREPESFRIELPGGTPTRALIWPGAEEAETALLIHHGLGEHAGRYQAYADGLPSTLPIVAYDVRGHGEAEGPRGVVRGLTQLASDLHAVMPKLLRRSGASKAVLFGHSMGAGAVGHYLTTHEVHDFVSGVWLSGVPTKVDLDFVRRIQRFAARLLDGLAPDVTLPTNLDANGISSVPAEIERYRNDPLVHDQASVALGRSLFDDPPKLLERGHLLTMPLYLFHGKDDTIVNVAGTPALFDVIASSDKTMNIIESARHETHHETEAIVTELMGKLTAWLQDHGAVAN